MSSEQQQKSIVWMAQAFAQLLGSRPQPGDLAFTRCLAPEVIALLIGSEAFRLPGWEVRCVNATPHGEREMSAERAVEWRETKASPACLLLVESQSVGPGMDGIYSSAREINEAELFAVANKIARNQVIGYKKFTDEAIRKAKQVGGGKILSPWVEFLYLCAASESAAAAGAALVRLGLWPIWIDGKPDGTDIDRSRLLVERLELKRGTTLAPEERVALLQLPDSQQQEERALVQLLRASDTEATGPLLEKVAVQHPLWLRRLAPGIFAAESVSALHLKPWRAKSGKPYRWSGLTLKAEPEPASLALLLQADPAEASKSRLEVRWTVEPDALGKGAVEYQVTVTTALEERLAEKTLSHTGRALQKVVFGQEDFSTLEEGDFFQARVTVCTLGERSAAIQRDESEAFVIHFGTTEEQSESGTGKIFPSLALAAATICEDQKDFEALAEAPSDTHAFGLDKRGYILCKNGEQSARVFTPPLLLHLARDWVTREGAIGRWRAVARSDGKLLEAATFVPLEQKESERFAKASQKFAQWLGKSGEGEQFRGPLGILYDDNSVFNEYILAAKEFWERQEPECALVQTLEVLSITGRSMGLIVLPTHPLRVAWQQGFDLLVRHHRYREKLPAKSIQDTLSTIAGTYCPPFLPGVKRGEVFVFADSLGFHAAALLPPDDPEPKSTVALMVRMLSDDDSSAPSVGAGAAATIGDEIARYMTLHPEYRRLRVVALGAGDAKPMVRALGVALGKELEYTKGEQPEGEASSSGSQRVAPCFELALHPANPEEMASVGRFIADTSERRHTGAGTIADQDRWLLESVPRSGGVTLPKLRWARRETTQPDQPAHLACAFDLFRSRVECRPLQELKEVEEVDGVLEIHGLALMPTRIFKTQPTPHWISTIPENPQGEWHPATRMMTRRQIWLQKALMRLVVKNLGGSEQEWPVLVTQIDASEDGLVTRLHTLCDWVITADRNAGIEYYDSPKELAEPFQCFIIDCVPERDDLGFMQIITSTSRMEEISRLLGYALGGMGLSNSEGNCRFLLNGLKSISGRLALRLAQRGNASEEMIAMALTQRHALQSQDISPNAVFPALFNGVFIPLDDIPELFALPGKKYEKRADLLYVAPAKRSGLRMIFIEVKYRRHLSTARAHELMEQIEGQIDSSCKRWEMLFGEETSDLEKSVNRARFARILRFYARKGLRHDLPPPCFQSLMREIKRLLTKKEALLDGELGRRGFIFCPEYRATTPDRIEHNGEAEIFLFGPDLLPDQVRVMPSSLQEREIFPQERETSRQETETSDREKAVADRETVTPKAKPKAKPKPLGLPLPLPQPLPLSLPLQAGRISPAPLPHTDPAAKPQSAEITPKNPIKEVALLHAEAVVQADNATPQEEQPTSAKILLGHRVPGAEPISWETSIKANPHLMILGLPGMGKTTCLINLCRQLEALAITPIVFSYHQDIDEKLAARLGQPPQEIRFSGLGFNPLEIHDLKNPLAFLDNAGMLRDIFAAIFSDLGDVQLGALREAIKRSYEDMGWSTESTGETPRFSAFLDILRSQPKPERNLLTRLNELDDYGLFSSSGRLPSLLESTETALIQIHQTQNDLLQQAFATFVFYNLYQNMFRRGPQQRITHAIIFDEAHRAARLKLLPTMAKECRKYGIALVLASQEAKDFDPSLYTAIAGYLAFRLNEVDAKFMAKKFAPSDQVTRYADQMKQMNKYQAMLYGEGTGAAKLLSLLDEVFLDKRCVLPNRPYIRIPE